MTCHTFQELVKLQGPKDIRVAGKPAKADEEKSRDSHQSLRGAAHGSDAPKRRLGCATFVALAGTEDIEGSFAHARAFYRAAVEALAVTENERAAAAASRSSTVAAGGAGGEGAELPMTRALRSWATMESYLRSAAEPCPDSTPIPRGYCVSAFADTMRSGCEGPDAVA